ncbi:MAG: SprT family zinc-dependent metalloprotease [Campylobacterota bacterium]|nr:SprT family zinc-dependent metalloprotease [Campylobacterota bacterium]
MNEIEFKEFKIRHICKKSLKNSYISVDKNSNILLKTPRVSKKFIDNILVEKEFWIRKQLLKNQQNPPQIVNLEDEVLLFGEIYSIDVDEARELREFLERSRTNTKQNFLKCYDKFYRLKALEYLTPRVEYFSKIMNLNYKELKFRKMRSRWGSCSSQRVITLNSELIKVKKECIDYVVVHELAHLVHMNHSKDFHSLVQHYIPHAKSLRKELKNINMATF